MNVCSASEQNPATGVHEVGATPTYAAGPRDAGEARHLAGGRFGTPAPATRNGPCTGAPGPDPGAACRSPAPPPRALRHEC